MALHGHTRLELIDSRGRIVRRVEKDNTITAYQAGIMGKGNFHFLIPNDKLMPVAEKFFSGCLLTDGKNASSGLPVSMIAHTSDIIAQASNDAYTGSGNLRRGSMDGYLSQPLSNGYRFVWNWDQSHGNGHIDSVCLCRAELGKMEMKATSDALSADAAYANEFFKNNVAVDSSLSKLNIIDYENSIGYRVYHDNGKIHIEAWELNTKEYYLLGKPLSAIRKVSEYDLTPSGGVVGYNGTNSCVSFTGDTIHFITFVVTTASSISTTTVHDYQIDTDDLSTVSVSDYVFQGVAFSLFPAAGLKDAIPIDDNNHKLYAICDNYSKIAICDLQNTQNVITVDNPLASVNSYQNGACLWLPNGDFYKFNYVSWVSSDVVNPILYFHNGRFYATKMLYKELYGCPITAVSGNNYGSAIVMGTSGSDVAYQKMHLQTFAPYVTTVNDLTAQQEVTKTPRFSMRLTYTLTNTIS